MTETDGDCARCKELQLIIGVRAMAVALASETSTIDDAIAGRKEALAWGRAIDARSLLHCAADELATHCRREHVRRTSERPLGE